jgi:hypothetical protein
MKSVTTGRVPIPVAICEMKTQSGKTFVIRRHRELNSTW